MYNEYQPSLLLAPYIDKYWEFKGNPDYGMKINILPDGCTDFIFTLGEVADIAEQESLIMQPYRSYFVGPMSRLLHPNNLCEKHPYVWYPFSALRFIPLHAITIGRTWESKNQHF